MKTVEKVWGSELWIANNDLYCCKVLSVDLGYRCSYHMHKIKDETFYVLRGIILMKHNNKEFFMSKESLPLRIYPGEYHSFVAMSRNVKIIEGSTQHFDGDSYREDKSCLVGQKEFGEYMKLMMESNMWRNENG